MSTLREIHERCKARHFVDESADGAPHPERPWCGFCFHSWPCADYADAVAALKAIDEAELTHEWEYPTRADARMVAFRLVPDPAPPTENT